VAKLTSQGNRVKVLTRDVAKARSKLPYSNIEFVGPEAWELALSGCYGVVNLAGEPIATRCGTPSARACFDAWTEGLPCAVSQGGKGHAHQLSPSAAAGPGEVCSWCTWPPDEIAYSSRDMAHGQERHVLHLTPVLGWSQRRQ
jgi:hypothetical protein